MTATYDNAVALILSAMREFNADELADYQIDISEDTVFFGRGGQLDSLGLVNMVLLVEEHIRDRCGVSVDLSNDRAMSQRNSPFRTVKTLARYVAGIVDGLVGGDA